MPAPRCGSERVSRMAPVKPADEIVYADYQSSKPVDPRVVEAMLPYFGGTFGNAASLHAVGDDATAARASSSAAVARCFGAQPQEIVFTSGATEANNLAIIGYAMRNRRKGDHVVITEAEHISVLNIAKYLEKNGFKVTHAPIDLYGRVSPKKLRARITDDTILVSVGWASNEIGTVQPIAEIAEMLAGSGVALHTDAVAAEGLVPIDMSAACARAPRTSRPSPAWPPPPRSWRRRCRPRWRASPPSATGWSSACSTRYRTCTSTAPRSSRREGACPTTPTSASRARKARPWCCRCATRAWPWRPARPAARRRSSPPTRSSPAGCYTRRRTARSSSRSGASARTTTWSASWPCCPASSPACGFSRRCTRPRPRREDQISVTIQTKRHCS